MALSFNNTFSKEFTHAFCMGSTQCRQASRKEYSGTSALYKYELKVKSNHFKSAIRADMILSLMNDELAS